MVEATLTAAQYRLLAESTIPVGRVQGRVRLGGALSLRSVEEETHSLLGEHHPHPLKIDRPCILA